VRERKREREREKERRKKKNQQTHRWSPAHTGFLSRCARRRERERERERETKQQSWTHIRQFFELAFDWAETGYICARSNTNIEKIAKEHCFTKDGQSFAILGK